MSFETPDDRAYLETHDWITLDGGFGTVGITDCAQDELGDVIFVELPMKAIASRRTASSVLSRESTRWRICTSR